MTDTLKPQSRSFSPSTLVLIGGGLVLSVLPLALPQSGLSLYWRVLGITLLGMSSLYSLLYRNVLVGTVLAITFASMFEAPMKYLSGEKTEALLGYIGRDLLIYLLTISVILSFITGISTGKRTKLMPPATFLIVCFLLNLLIQLFNPDSVSPVASFLNSRIFWEMIPLYFLGFYFLRDLKSWKWIFITFAIMTCLNGAVATFQSSAGPEAIAAWGPGYKTQIYDYGRTFSTEAGELTFRPFGLGTDMGFSGLLGNVTVPMLATLLFARGREKNRVQILSLFRQVLGVLLVSLLAAGTFIAIIISASRSYAVLSVVAGVVSLLFFTWKTPKVRLVFGLGISFILAFAAFQLVAIVAPNYGERYKSIQTADETVKTFNSEGRNVQITAVPINIAIRHPFGAGMDNVGPGAEFAGKLTGSYVRPQLENTENNINLTILAQGVPGLFLWLLLHFRFLQLSWNARNKVKDPEAQLFLTGGFVLMLVLLLQWPFGNLITFPFNLLFWLIPGMLLGTAEEYVNAEKTERIAKAKLLKVRSQL